MTTNGQGSRTRRLHELETPHQPRKKQGEKNSSYNRHFTCKTNVEKATTQSIELNAKSRVTAYSSPFCLAVT